MVALKDGSDDVGDTLGIRAACSDIVYESYDSHEILQVYAIIQASTSISFSSRNESD